LSSKSTLQNLTWKI